MSRQPGPPPKPTVLHILAGNPSKKKLNTHEAKPEPGIPSPPSHLTVDARREWRRIAKLLDEVGLLTKVDRAALAMYCQAYGRWVGAENEVSRVGTVVRSPKNYPIINPHLSIANRAMEQMRSLMGELGLSPAARSRIVVKKGEPDDDEEFFGRRPT